MADVYICQSCGEAFDDPGNGFALTCPACGHRHQPRAGCC